MFVKSAVTGSGFLARMGISLRTQMCEEHAGKWRGPGRTYFADKFALLNFIGETFS